MHDSKKTTGHGLSQAALWLGREFPLSDLPAALPTALLCWFLTVIFSVSLAALIFHGKLESSLSFGIGMSLFTAAAAGLVVTFIGTVPGTIVIPSDRTAPMLALLTGAIAAAVPVTTSHSELLEITVTALILSTFVTGIALAMMGHYRWGRLIRFLPFPVVGGFMAGAGWLLVRGALHIILGFEVTPQTMLRLTEPDLLAKWVPTVGLAFVLTLMRRRWQHFLVVPGFVLGAVALFYLIAFARGLSLAALRSGGWLPGPFPEAVTWHPVSLNLLVSANWLFLWRNISTFETILLVSAISLLMISSALELALARDVDADRELEAAGIANLVAACGGGLVGLHSLSLSSLSLRLGPHSRWVGLLTSLGAGLTLFLGPSIVSFLPMPVIGGLLCYLGLNFLSEWLIDAYPRVPRSDYLIIILIVIAIAWVGYIPGVGIGLVTAVVLFALRYSRIDVVRLEITGANHRSNVDRPPHERELLARELPTIHILKLQGFIFFGTSHGLLHRVNRRAHDANQPPLRYLVVDFRHVSGLDSSALLSFAKLQQTASQLKFRLLGAGLPPKILQGLKRDPALFTGDGAMLVQPDSDHAVEWCEEQILAPHRDGAQWQAPPFEELLAIILQGRQDIAQRLAGYFERMEVPAGGVLATQGERTRDLFLIERGQISARFKTDHGEPIRLRTMGSGSIIGEIGMYLHTPRTASLIADSASIVWKLTPESLTRMEETEPAVTAVLHETLARIVSLRLIQANQLLETALK